MRRSLIAAVVVLTAFATSCTDSGVHNVTGGASGSTTSADGTTDDTTVGSSGFDWTPSGDNDRVETGHLQVPRDYSDPSKGTFDLYLARHLADHVGAMPRPSSSAWPLHGIQNGHVYRVTLLEGRIAGAALV